jgi:hypothetical protein
MRFIIFCIWPNCFNKRFTSCIRVPEPAAIRRLREALIRAGYARCEPTGPHRHEHCDRRLGPEDC